MERLRPVLFLFAVVVMLMGTGGVRGIDPVPAPLSRAQIISLLRSGVSPKRIVTLVEQRGINFEPSA